LSRHWTLPYGSLMDRERLFVQTVDWLDQVARRQPPDEHELLLASGRLRMLLLDAQRLTDQVNKTYSFDIRYRIVRARAPVNAAHLEFWARTDGIAPAERLADAEPRLQEVPVQTFLHELVMIYRGEKVTVRDLIDHLANVVGGVHAGKAREERDLKLNQLAESLSLGGMSPGIRAVRGIVVVVAEALKPLRDAIAEDHAR
jgi:hypothetical protein